MKGGSGEYVWSSSKVETTTVNNKGEITTGNGGEAQIIASDAKNRAHTGSAKVMSPTWTGKGLIVKTLPVLKKGMHLLRTHIWRM